MVLTTQSINVSNMYSTVPPVGMVISGELVDTNLLSTWDVVWILPTEKRLFHTTLVSCALNSPGAIPCMAAPLVNFLCLYLLHPSHRCCTVPQCPSAKSDKGWCWSHLWQIQWSVHHAAWTFDPITVGCNEPLYHADQYPTWQFQWPVLKC